MYIYISSLISWIVIHAIYQKPEVKLQTKKQPNLFEQIEHNKSQPDIMKPSFFAAMSDQFVIFAWLSVSAQIYKYTKCKCTCMKPRSIIITHETIKFYFTRQEL